MNMPVPAAGKPFPDLLRLVRRAVVHHQVRVQPFWRRRLDLLEDGKELRGAAAPAALPDHRAGGGEERCRAAEGAFTGSPPGPPPAPSAGPAASCPMPVPAISRPRTGRRARAAALTFGLDLLQNPKTLTMPALG